MIDIVQLEDEINKFHTNVTSSTELLTLLRNTIQALTENAYSLKQNANTFETASENIIACNTQQSSIVSNSVEKLVQSGESQVDELGKIIDKSISRITEENSNATAKTNDRISSVQERIQENIRELEMASSQIIATGHEQMTMATEKIQNAVQKLEESDKETIANAVKQLQSVQDNYLSEIEHLSESFEEQTIKINKQYQSLLKKIEDSQIDQFYDFMISLKRSINGKLALILSGTVVAIFISIIGLFM